MHQKDLYENVLQGKGIMIDQQFLSAKYDGLQMDGKMLKEASYTTSGERVFITQSQLKLLDSHKTSHIQ